MIKCYQEIKNTQLKAFSAAEWPESFVGSCQLANPPPSGSSLQYILQDDLSSILLLPNFFKLLVKTNLFYKLF
jgi:hypothetical protein